MRLAFTPEQEEFRATAAAWLNAQLAGPFRHLKGMRGMSEEADERRKWEQAMGAARWSCIGWPTEYGGRGASLAEQVIFAEEYARSGAPGRINHIGVELAGPTLIALGSEEQKQRFLPRIAQGLDVWCQGYSEPNAGSDLANVRTAARLEGGKWIIDGQKIWTSLGHVSDWAFVVCRTEKGSQGPKGLSYLLVPMRQKGVTIRPIKQMSGEAEFNEVFFDGAETDEANIVGKPGDGWKVAMATLSFERGVSTLAQQMEFKNEMDDLIEAAKKNGKAKDPLIRQRLAEAYSGLKIMRYNALRMLSAEGGDQLSSEGYTYKIYWATWRRNLGDLAMDVLGPEGQVGEAGYRFNELTLMHLRSRADTIYGGTNQIQRNIIAERALGLPREPRGQQGA